MSRDTSFCVSWLEQTDANGHVIKSWCKPDPHSTTAGYCTLCCKQVPCANMGELDKYFNTQLDQGILN